MHNVISFIKVHPVLCVLLSVLLIGILAAGLFFARGSLSDAADPPDTETVAEAETSAMTETTEETEPVTEAETDPPIPYYPEEVDSPYYLSSSYDGEFPAVISVSEDHRIYAAYPQTDSEAFNDYCQTTVASLMTSAQAAETARLGGTTVVVIDYTLYTADTVYSAVFVKTVMDTAQASTAQSVVVLIYDTAEEAVYAPLDLYDMTKAGVTLAERIRSGYEGAFASVGLAVDDVFLDEVCTPDPSSFVNIAVDAENMYFFTVYDASDAPTLLCAAVPFADMEEYTWAAIEAALEAEKQAEEAQRVPVEIPDYDFSAAVPESAAVDSAYFNDAVFIGNSLIVGLQKAAPLDAWYFAGIGLNVSQVFTKPLIPMQSGNTFTVSEALETVDFSKVYLMFGINELGWGSITSFIGYYSQIIDRIREVNPDAIIYVQSILPINEEKWAKSRDYQSCINNYAVATFNQKILEMCVAKNVAFVNVGEILRDETGNLFADATSDGIHIGGVYATRWVDYLKTHTVAAP